MPHDTPESASTSRRALLGAFGALAGGVNLLTDTVADERTPAAQVEDRASSIRITASCRRARAWGSKSTRNYWTPRPPSRRRTNGPVRN